MQNLKEHNMLTEHQRTLLAMLKDLDAVCARHGIRYGLFSGTALGAVRHGGFIPWDDDLDVVMLREDYERFFVSAAPDLDPERYYVQREFGPHWPMQFSKLRLNGTACMERFHPKDPELHQGVYLDIFPCDNLADNRLLRALQFAASKVVIAKALDARGYETNKRKKKAFMRLCRLLPREPFWRLCVRRKDTGSAMVHTFFGCGSKYEKNIFERSWFENRIPIAFEDGVFPISREYDRLLTTLYGDYRILPKPEEIEQKKHAVILDLHRPYTEYLGQQKAMQFDVLSRSMR